VESRVAVKNALAGEKLDRPDVLDEVTTAPVSVRGSNEGEEAIRIVYPTSAVIAQTQPKLRWAASQTAAAYRIEIADEGFHQIAKSPDLPASTLTWTTTSALKRGMAYTWTIRAVNQNGELSSVTSQGKFKVLAEDKVRKLNQLKVGQSHLALGLFYAREGMVAEAEREFGTLVKDNPDSALPKRLLREVRAWQRR
jgi:predicted phage tail protein